MTGKMKFGQIAAAIFLILSAPAGEALPQDTFVEQSRFKPGATRFSPNGSLALREVAPYQVGAGAGQHMSILFSSGNAAKKSKAVRRDPEIKTPDAPRFEGGWAGRNLIEGSVGVRRHVLAVPSAEAPVQSPAGSRRADLMANPPDDTRRYVLNVKNSRYLDVRVAPDSGALIYQIYKPDNTFLFDTLTSDQEYRGQLWQAGNQFVGVINRGKSALS